MALVAAEGRRRQETQLGDLPEESLAQVIALTSPRDASRCAAVSPSFRAAADSDHVWQRFIPRDRHFLLPPPATAKSESGSKKKKDAYLGLCDAASAAAVGEDGGCRVWLDRDTGPKCYALSARRLSLPWDDGEFCWKFTPHPLFRFDASSSLTLLLLFSHTDAEGVAVEKLKEAFKPEKKKNANATLRKQ